MDLKILHVFNMANAPYYLVKGLRMFNVQADLVYSKKEGQISDPSNEGSQKREPWLIEWEGDSLHMLANKRKFFELYTKSRKYDLLHFHYPSSIFLQFTFKPFVVHETGWMRVALSRNTMVEKLMKRSLKKAKCVVMTNPDLYSVLEHLDHQKDFFIPFGVDTSFYSPNDELINEDIVFLHPNRQHWEYKGTDKLLKAFSRFTKENSTAKLILIKYGKDLQKTINLIEKLKLEKNIIWKNLMDKKELVKLYHLCHAVLDQFNVGSYGVVGTEALCCGKPLIIYLDEKYFLKSFGELCPVLQARTEDEIYDAMNIIKDKNAQKKFSIRSREFAIKHHSLKSIGQKCIKLYNEII